MKVRYFTIVFLLLVFIIPMSFASDDFENITDGSNEVVEVDDAVSEISSNDINQDISYFSENSRNIEAPLIDDDFADPKISLTDRNTFYVNSSYQGIEETGSIDKPFKSVNSAFSGLTFNKTVSNIFIASGFYEVSKISFNKNLNIIGENPLNTVLSGKNISEIFFINKNSLSVNIINLTFTQGNTYYGGAIYNNHSSVKLINTIFNENYAIGYNSSTISYSPAGGALYNEAGTYKIYNSTFIGNVAKSSLNVYGGAIYNDLGTLSILNSKFINNRIYDGSYGSGGAIYNFNGFLTVLNTSFENNIIESNYSIGGSIYNYESHNVYVINSSFNENKIYGNYALGSAIASSASILEVVNSTVSNNLACGIAPENSTIYNFNGIYNFINSTMANNTIEFPQKNLLMLLEDQFVISNAIDSIENLPSKYDLRDEGLVTYAKDQGSSGACWTFSILAALESYLLKNENMTFDLSENNMKNVMNHYGVNGTDWYDGGNYQMALAYLLRWSGPVYENDDSFSSYSVIPNYDLTPVKHVQGAMFLPMRLGYLDNDQIKAAIMKYGALYVSIDGVSITKNVYHSSPNIPNHAVAIVGWDDEYPASKFIGTKPAGDGAFIIKNSWGSSYGERGFGYVSYYDQTFGSFSLDSISALAFTSVENITNYKNIYQYDLLGNTYESLGFNSNVAWMANQFKATSNNPLSAFGLYTYGASDYLAEIYVNGDLKYSQEGKIGYGGYHTIKLNELVKLTMGDTFRINVMLNTYDSIFPISIESSRNGYSTKATADLNQSFISPDGVNWIDIAQNLDIVKISECLFNKTLENANVCLKAYTANIGELILNVTSSASYYLKDDEVMFTLNISNVGNDVKGINVSLVLDEIADVISWNCSKGSVSKNIWHIESLNNKESAILNLTLKISGNKDSIENKAIINCLDDITRNNETISFNLSYSGFTSFIVKNVTSLSKSNAIINFTIVDLTSKPVSNVDVFVKFSNGENATLKSDENGMIYLKINLYAGNYTCNIYFNGNDVYRPSNQSFNVNVIKRNSRLINVGANIFFYPDGPSVLLFDENTNSLVNRPIIFSASNVTVNLTTDNNGIAALSNFKSGNHTMIALFEGDELYDSCQIMFNITIIKKDTQISSENINTYAVVTEIDGKKGSYLKVTLRDDNYSLLAYKTVEIKLNSKIYNIRTNKNGVASLQINIAKSGTYVAKITFLGDDGYQKSSTLSTKIFVKKMKMTLNVAKKTYKKSKKTKKLTAILKDNYGKVISGKKITFKVKGKKYIAKTNKKGVATVKVNISKKKTYAVTASFNGDSTYGKITKKSKLTIK